MAPPELLDQIFSYLVDDSDYPSLLACALTSTELYDQAQPLIYRHIKLDDMSDEANRRRNLLLRTLETGKYDTLIQHLEFTGDPQKLEPLIPHLTCLKSLSLREDNMTIMGRVFESSPDSIVTALQKLFSQDGFTSLDFHNYVLNEPDLQYLLGGAKDLKHLGFTRMSSVYFHSVVPIQYPARRPNTGPARLDSLTLGFSPAYPESEDEAVKHPILRWLLTCRDCAVDVTGVKNFKMENGGWYKVPPLVKRFRNCLESFSWEEYYVKDDLSPMETQQRRIKFMGWFCVEKYPNLRNLSFIVVENNKSCEWSPGHIGLLWLVMAWKMAPTAAPNLENVTLDLYGGFHWKMPKDILKSVLYMGDNEIVDKFHHAAKSFTNLPNERDKALVFERMTAKFWSLLGGISRECTKSTKVKVNLIDGKARGELDEKGLEQRSAYARFAKKMFKMTTVEHLKDQFTLEVFDGDHQFLTSGLEEA